MNISRLNMWFIVSIKDKGIVTVSQNRKTAINRALTLYKNGIDHE